MEQRVWQHELERNNWTDLIRMILTLKKRDTLSYIAVSLAEKSSSSTQDLDKQRPV